MIMKARLSHPASKEKLNVRIELIKFQAKHWSVGMSQGLNTPAQILWCTTPTQDSSNSIELVCVAFTLCLTDL